MSAPDSFLPPAFDPAFDWESENFPDGYEDADGSVPGADECPCDGPFCAACGCCLHRACPGGCVWATPTLCSRCVR